MTSPAAIVEVVPDAVAPVAVATESGRGFFDSGGVGELFAHGRTEMWVIVKLKGQTAVTQCAETTGIGPYLLVA